MKRINRQIRFQVGGKKGVLFLEVSRIPAFISYIREAGFTGAPDFVIKAEETDDPSFSIDIQSKQEALMRISRSQVMHPYGLMTVFKALLQAVLIDEDIILFHGRSDGAGVLMVNGTETSWFDSPANTESRFKRLVIAAKAGNRYLEYSDLLAGADAIPPVIIRSCISPSGFVCDERFLFESTWFYFFFYHFIRNTGKLSFLPA
jgi:hypothetical protein